MIQVRCSLGENILISDCKRLTSKAAYRENTHYGQRKSMLQVNFGQEQCSVEFG